MSTDASTLAHTAMPQYLCHKKVRALKIKEILPAGELGVQVIFENAAFPRRYFSEDFVERRGMFSGGYYVVYDDGYESFSPAEAFEAGYTLITKPSGEPMPEASAR